MGLQMVNIDFNRMLTKVAEIIGESAETKNYGYKTTGVDSSEISKNVYKPEKPISDEDIMYNKLELDNKLNKKKED